jgi:hypothetical protein
MIFIIECYLNSNDFLTMSSTQGDCFQFVMFIELFLFSEQRGRAQEEFRRNHQRRLSASLRLQRHRAGQHQPRPERASQKYSRVHATGAGSFYSQIYEFFKLFSCLYCRLTPVVISKVN